MNEKRRVSEEISDLLEQQAELARQLNASLLMEEFWPEAFAGGQSCRECAILDGYGNIKKTWLERTDGIKRAISLSKFKQLQEYRDEHLRA